MSVLERSSVLITGGTGSSGKAFVRTMLEHILAQHTGRTPEQVREDTERDLILTPQAALDYGVVDAVLTRRTTYGG